ncbi:hypothetical protein LSAT2_002206 [Lamellibrachia satsuma]|nr:hypothetical protein LSAT2_002206 [Lamellibrachia satsuma]
MIRLSSTVSVGRNGHMVSSAGDVGSGGAGDDDDEVSWSHVDDTGLYDGDMGLKNDGSGDNDNDDGGGGDCAGDVIYSRGGPDTRKDSDGSDSRGDDGVGVVVGDFMHGGGGPDGDEESDGGDSGGDDGEGDLMQSGVGPDGDEDSDGGDSGGNDGEGAVIGDVMHSGGGPDGDEDSSGYGWDSDDGGGGGVVVGGCGCGCGGDVIDNRLFYLIQAHGLQLNRRLGLRSRQQLTTIGTKLTFVAGVVVCGGSVIGFGCLDAVPSGTTFIVMCIVIRGAAFLAVGGLASLLLPPQTEINQRQRNSFWSFMTILPVWLIGFFSITVLSAFGLCDAALAVHMKTNYHLSTVPFTAVFLVIGGVYGVSSVVCGVIADKKIVKLGVTLAIAPPSD